MIEITKDQRIANMLEHVEKELEVICEGKYPFSISTEAKKSVIDNTHGNHSLREVVVWVNEKSYLHIQDTDILPF